jgi:hypothetical protein
MSTTKTELESDLVGMFLKWGWAAGHVEDENKRAFGRKVWFRNPKWRYSYTCEVATLPRDGILGAPNAEAFKSISADRVFHLNPHTGEACWYGVKDMVKYIQQNPGIQSINLFDIRIPFISHYTPKKKKTSYAC